MKLQFTLLGREVALQARLAVRPKRNQPVQGYTNRCKDGKFIILIDYDINTLKWIVQELDYIQEEFKIGDFHLFKTNKGYHAVCFDKVTMKEYINIINRTSCDPDHTRIPLKYGQMLWTLRWSEKESKKPEYIMTVHSKHNMLRFKSSPHMEFVKLKLGLPLEYANQDFEQTMIASSYKV